MMMIIIMIIIIIIMNNTNVEKETYDYTGNNWSHQNSKKTFI